MTRYRRMRSNLARASVALNPGLAAAASARSPVPCAGAGTVTGRQSPRSPVTSGAGDGAGRRGGAIRSCRIGIRCDPTPRTALVRRSSGGVTDTRWADIGPHFATWRVCNIYHAIAFTALSHAVAPQELAHKPRCFPGEISTCRTADSGCRAQGCRNISRRHGTCYCGVVRRILPRGDPGA